MSLPSRWGFARLARWVVALGALAVLGVGQLSAQGTTGKIEGTIRDQAGAPIAGAQVLIVGSAFATVSNEQGYYFFNGVPAGVVTVRAQYIGYAPAETRNVRVFAAQTMTINMALEQRAIEVGGITVTVEQNPIVPRDQVTSKPIIQGDLVQDLPVDNVTGVLRLQPGVVESARGLSIRGGRVGEEILYVDGVPVRSASGRTGRIQIGTNAVEEASVTTGAIGATQGDAQSGVISIVTRSGGTNYSGFISYETDELQSDANSQGWNRIEASFGGPIIQNLTFFASLTMTGQQNGLRGKGAGEFPDYVLGGVDTTVTVAATPGDPASDSVQVDIPAFTEYGGQRLQDDWTDTYQMSAKLQYSYGTGSRISGTLHRQRIQDLGYRGGNLYNTAAQTGSRQYNSAFIVNWAQNLSRSSERALFLDVSASYQWDDFVATAIDMDWFNDHRTPFGWFSPDAMELAWEWEDFPIDENLITNLRTNNCQGTRPGGYGACVPMLNRQDLDTKALYRFNPWGVTRNIFPQAGPGDAGLSLQRENRITARANLDWQANRYNRVQVGGDLVRADSKTFNSGLTDPSFMDANIYSPSRIGLYVTDRLDLGDVVVDLGLRYDRTDPDVMYSRYVGRIFSDPLRNGDSTYAQSDEDRAIARSCGAYRDIVQDVNASQADRDAARVQWSTCNMVEAEAKSVLLPSIRVSFPVTDRTGFRLSYAQQAQAPQFNVLATGANTDINLTNSNDDFARDLDYGKTILFEFGIRHAFSPDLVLDIAAYNKDKVSDVTARKIPFYDPGVNTTQQFNVYTNLDFGNSRGIDLRLDSRVGSLFQASVAYTFQTSKSTGSDPLEYLNTLGRVNSNVTGDVAPPPQAQIVTRDNRTHTLAGSMALNFPHGWGNGFVGTILQDAGAFLTFRFASGLVYTRLENVGSGQLGPGNGFGLSGTPVEPLNSSVGPWYRNVDLRLTKGFRFLGTRELTLYADIRNLLDFTVWNSFYSETGDVVNSLHREKTISPIRTTLYNDAGSAVVTRPVLDDNGNVIGSETGIDLGGDCSQYLPSAQRGLVDCIALRRVEERFRIGEYDDYFFSEAEQNAAFNNYYDRYNSPGTSKYAPGRNIRFGLQFNF